MFITFAGGMGRDTLGRHILVEFFGCKPEILNDVSLIEQAMLTATERAGATVISSAFHHFSPFGVSGMVVIQESHLAIHTWPEFGYAAVDIFTCGEDVNPWEAYRHLKQALQAEYGAALEMHRGQMDILSRYQGWDASTQDGVKKVRVHGVMRDVWFTERHEEVALSFKYKGDVLFRKRSPYQRVEVYDSLAFGKTLVLDGLIQCAEEDQFIYHETIVHPAMLIHGRAGRILVVGGGDGGVVHEVLKHRDTVRSIDLVEIDEVVLEAAQKFFSWAKTLKDPRVHLHIEDGLQFTHRTNSEFYDIVIVDSSDPVGPSKDLFSPGFVRDVYRVLKTPGIYVTQSGSPFLMTEHIQDFHEVLEEVFGEEKVFPFWATVPTYPGGLWLFFMCVKGELHPLEGFDFKRAALFASENRLQFYNGEMHRVLFTIPPFIKDMLDVGEQQPAEIHRQEQRP